MKKILYLFILSVAFFMVGCDSDDEVAVNPGPDIKDDQVTENQEGNPGTEGKSEENQGTGTGQTFFLFTSFDLDVKYDVNKEYEIEYEQDRDGLEAELKDDLNNEVLRGEAAFERLRPIFESFTFTKDTERDEVIREVLEAFSLTADYREFDLEIDFSDGTKKEYHDVK